MEIQRNSAGSEFELLLSQTAHLRTAPGRLKTEPVSFIYDKLITWPPQQLQVRLEQEYSKYFSKEIKFTCADSTISIKSRAAFTNIGSVGVRAGSIQVTRVISFTFVNIWETIYIFALYHVCHLKNGQTLSRVITLIWYLYRVKQIFYFFVFHELDIWNVHFFTNISVYQAIGFGTTVFSCSSHKTTLSRGE